MNRPAGDPPAPPPSSVLDRLTALLQQQSSRVVEVLGSRGVLVTLEEPGVAIFSPSLAVQATLLEEDGTRLALGGSDNGPLVLAARLPRTEVELELAPRQGSGSSDARRTRSSGSRLSSRAYPRLGAVITEELNGLSSRLLDLLCPTRDGNQLVVVGRGVVADLQRPGPGGLQTMVRAFGLLSDFRLTVALPSLSTLVLRLQRTP